LRWRVWRHRGSRQGDFSLIGHLTSTEFLEIQGADEAAESIGLKPLMSGVRTEDEGLFVVQHKYWQEALQRALSAEATPGA
jgi:hypothetical protein